MIGDILNLRGLVVVREDHRITLRRKAPNLFRPVRVGHTRTETARTGTHTARTGTGTGRTGTGRVVPDPTGTRRRGLRFRTRHDLPQSPAEPTASADPASAEPSVEVFDLEYKTLFA